MTDNGCVQITGPWKGFSRAAQNSVTPQSRFGFARGRSNRLRSELLLRGMFPEGYPQLFGMSVVRMQGGIVSDTRFCEWAFFKSSRKIRNRVAGSVKREKGNQ